MPMSSILVLGELTDGKALDPVTGELIAAGRQVAEDIGVVLLGTDIDGPCPRGNCTRRIHCLYRA